MLLRELGIAGAAAQDGGTPVAISLAMTGCFVDSDGVAAEPWVRSELFFGTTKPDGTAYTNEEWL
jgi:hypothetical protein